MVVVALALQILCTSNVHAAPSVNLDPYLVKLADERSTVALDLRNLWESGWVRVGALQPNTVALNPQTVWSWPQTLFVFNPLSAKQVLGQGQRFVARLELVSASSGPDINLTFKMPRLDAVHVAYRYDDGVWVQASAGDTIPMAKWPFVDRQPSFDLPLRQGRLSLVVEIAHQGVIDAPMVLQNAHSIHKTRMNAAASNGILIGINLVLTMVGILAALSYRRWSFLAISVMTLLMSAMVSTNSGLAGVYLFTDSTTFNDESKFFTTALRAVLFPWMTALVLSQRYHARHWWRASEIWAVLGLVITVWWMQYSLRNTATTVVTFTVLASTALALTILANAVLGGQVHAKAMAPGVLLYAVSLLLPLFTYLGYALTENMLLYSSLITLAAALVLLDTLLRQYRQGRMVLARAKTSIGRDMLTGLLSRKGFIRKLDLTVQRIEVNHAYAAFFYIALSDVATLKDSYGEEGYESGMVQMAAAISSSMSVADNVGRVAPNAFAVSTVMPHDAKLASQIAQKILSRILALSSHGVPMADSARIALAWLPVFGTNLPDLERSAQRTISEIEAGKRIAWIGGVQAQQNAQYPTSGIRTMASDPQTTLSQHDPLTSLPEVTKVISRLEQEMLGTRSQHPKDTASQVL
jgi:GGDEF domain-containing protein